MAAITAMNRATTIILAAKVEENILRIQTTITMVNVVDCNMMPTKNSLLRKQTAPSFTKAVINTMEILWSLENVNTPNLGHQMDGRCEMKSVVVDKEAYGTGGKARVVSENSPRNVTGGANVRLIAMNISIRGELAKHVGKLNATNRNAMIVKTEEAGVVAALWFMQIKRRV